MIDYYDQLEYQKAVRLAAAYGKTKRLVSILAKSNPITVLDGQVLVSQDGDTLVNAGNMDNCLICGGSGEYFHVASNKYIPCECQPYVSPILE